VGWLGLLHLLTTDTSLDPPPNNGDAIRGDVDFVNQFLGWVTSNETTRSGLAQLGQAVT
jgi:hypothetical protein